MKIFLLFFSMIAISIEKRMSLKEMKEDISLD
jgi:hypothetical protein